MRRLGRLLTLRRYWLARSRYAEALALLLPVLERPEARTDPRLFGEALVTAAVISPFVDLAPTRRLGEQAVELGRELHDDQLLSEALSVTSVAWFYLGETDRSLLLGQEAVERARQADDDVLLGQSLMAYLLSSAVIQPAQSGSLLAEAIACTGRSGDQPQVRAHLGDERFDQAYGEGQTLSIDEALHSTLRQSAQPDPPVTI